MPQDDSLDPDLSVIQNLVVYARYFDIPKKRSVPYGQGTSRVRWPVRKNE